MTALNHHVLCNGIRIRNGIRTHALISGNHGIHADVCLCRFLCSWLCMHFEHERHSGTRPRAALHEQPGPSMLRLQGSSYDERWSTRLAKTSSARPVQEEEASGPLGACQLAKVNTRKPLLPTGSI